MTKREKDIFENLITAAEHALKEAESWTQDQLEGTSDYESSMAEFQTIRNAIKDAKDLIA